jgi:hypothetical protein
VSTIGITKIVVYKWVNSIKFQYKSKNCKKLHLKFLDFSSYLHDKRTYQYIEKVEIKVANANLIANCKLNYKLRYLY